MSRVKVYVAHDEHYETEFWTRSLKAACDQVRAWGGGTVERCQIVRPSLSAMLTILNSEGFVYEREQVFHLEAETPTLEDADRDFAERAAP